MTPQERENRDRDIIALYRAGRKQLDIADELGVAKSTVNRVIWQYRTDMICDEYDPLEYQRTIRLKAVMIKEGDVVRIDDTGVIATVIHKYPHTVLCIDKKGLKHSPRYQDVTILWEVQT